MKKTNSYQKIYFSVFLLLCVLPSCTNNSREKDDIKDRNNISLQELKLTGLKTNADFQAGKTELIPTKNHEILILIPTNEIVSGDNSKKTMECRVAYIIQMDSISQIPERLSTKGIALYKSALLLTASKSELYFMAVNNKENRSLYKNVVEQSSGKIVTPFFGYGFATYNGKWEVDNDTQFLTALDALRDSKIEFWKFWK